MLLLISTSILLASARLTAAQAGGQASPIPTEVTPEQSSRIVQDFSSYNSVLERNAHVLSLALAIDTWLPIGSWDNWNAVAYATQPETTDYLALATATPTYRIADWLTGLPGSLQVAWLRFETSVAVAHESIVRSELGILARTDLPAATAGIYIGPTANPTFSGIPMQTAKPELTDESTAVYQSDSIYGTATTTPMLPLFATGLNTSRRSLLPPPSITPTMSPMSPTLPPFTTSRAGSTTGSAPGTTSSNEAASIAGRMSGALVGILVAANAFV